MLNHLSQKGFSIIELLLVVVIIGILGTVAVPSLIKSREVAERGMAVGILRTIQSQQMLFMTEKKRYARLDELNTLTNNSLGTISGSQLIRGSYRYIMSPTPTNLSLKNQFRIIVYRKSNRTFIPAFLMSQDGVIQTIIP
jgi:prepilin-type N-terminal cleavage/methylation domain-containing protein